MVVLDESEILLNHVDEGKMNNRDIDIWKFFVQIMKHSDKLIRMDGDISQRTLKLAS